MNGYKILVVDDEPDLREILQYNLENAGYTVVTASSAEEALNLITPDCSLILLDVMMKGMSGFKMAKILRNEKYNNVPIIFLTAKDSENDLLTGFSAGGDDYIAKPFSLQEVLVRIKALLRRSQERVTVAGHETEYITIDYSRKIIKANEEEIRLTPKDFGIVALLLSNKGHLFSREEILAKVWKNEDCVLKRTVDVHIAHIRRKMGTAGDCIQGRPGFGYCFEEQ